MAGAGAVFLVTLAVLMIVARPRRTRHSPAASAESPGTVTEETAELRPEPAAGARLLATLPRGTRVSVVADHGRWLEVRTAEKKSGFLLLESVETDADRDARQKRGSKVFSFPAVFGVVAQDTEVLLAPFPLAPHAGRLHRGETISIHAVDHDYYAFRWPDGGLAFARSADIDLVPPDPRRPAIVPDVNKALKDVKVADLSPVETPEPSGETGGESAAETFVRSAAEEEPAVLMSKIDPRYPEAARRAGVEGTVVLDATIDETGSVKDLQVLRGLPLGISEAAVDAVSRWKYRPARGKNGPVPSHKTIRVTFKLGE